jgi:hypothetical protein
MTLRPGFWRPSILIPLGLLIALSGVFAASKLAVGQPGQAVLAFLAPVVVLLLVWLRTLPVRLEIEETVVRVRQGGYRGQPDMEMPRSEIRSVRYLPRRISFRGPDDKPIMEPTSHWTLRQMLKVAKELDVPLYNHRGVLRPEELSSGRLVYDPASRQSVS